MISFMQLILIICGAVSIALAADGVPAIWSVILPWLRPPYLHVVIHCIIIVIAAASCFGRGRSAPPVRSQHLISVTTPPPAYYVAYTSSPEVRAAAAEAEYEIEDRVVELKPVVVNGFEVDADAEIAVAEDDGESALAGRMLPRDNPPPEIYSSEFRLEYFPPVNPNGMIHEMVTRETVENSWKKKNGGTSRAAREEAHHHDRAPPQAPDHFRYNMRKSKSFRERTIYVDSPSTRASSVTRKKASRSRNESNRRVGFEENRSASHKSLSLEKSSPELQPDYLSPENPYGNISQLNGEGEEYETMESAWKKITEGASRAADEEENRYAGSLQVRAKVAKSRSLKERPAASSRMEREFSSAVAAEEEEEFNRRVEAFIKKVNEEIRLCRKKSLDQYIQLNSAA